MNKSTLTIIPLLFFSLLLLAQPSIQWQKAFGGSLYEQANSIIQTTDHGFIATGRTVSDDGDVVNNHGGYDFWVVKMDSTGIIQWKNTYGGSNNDWPYAIQQTNDGNFVVVGYTESNDGNVSGNHGDKDIWVLNLNNNGAIQWQKTLGGSGWEEAWSVKQTFDGGLVIVGRSSSIDGDVTDNHGGLDYWVIKLNSSGTLEWQKSLGGSGIDLAYDVCQASDGGFIICGESDSQDGDVKDNHGNSDFWVVKLNSEGTMEWENSLGGSNIDRANSIHQSREGGYIIFGQTRSINGDVTGNHGGYDCWVVKLDETGALEWQKTMGGSDEDYGHSFQQTPDGTYILAGFTSSTDGDVQGNHGDADVWILKLSEEGEIQWQKTLGGTGPERGYSIQQTTDQGYILSGDAWSNNGDVSGVHGKTDFWIVKLAPESSPTSEIQSFPLDIFPNPAQQSIAINCPSFSSVAGEGSFITMRITDLLGREMLTQQIYSSTGLGSVRVDIAALPKGLYLLTATPPSGKVYAGKFRKV